MSKKLYTIVRNKRSQELGIIVVSGSDLIKKDPNCKHLAGKVKIMSDRFDSSIWSPESEWEVIRKPRKDERASFEKLREYRDICKICQKSRKIGYHYNNQYQPEYYLVQKYMMEKHGK